MNGRVLAIGLASVVLSVWACGDDSDPPATTPMAAVTVRFDFVEGALPKPLDVPWPTDLYLSADGTVDDGLTDWANVRLGRAQVAFAGIGQLDGFGRTAGAIFLLDGDVGIDRTTVPASAASCSSDGAPVALVDLEATDASAARVPCVARWDARASTLAIVPDRVLAEGRRYAAVVTDAIAAIDGTPIAASEAFVAMRDAPADQRTTPAQILYGDALDTVTASLGIDRASIVGIAPFTTQTTIERMRALHARTIAEPVPALVTGSPFGTTRFGVTMHTGWTATLSEVLGTPPLDAEGRHVGCLDGRGSDVATPGLAHDAIGVYMLAAFQSPRFTRDYAATGALDDGTIEWSASGEPIVVDQAWVPVVIALPATPPPATGYPVVIVQHGGGGHRAVVAAFANDLARDGIATIGIDAPYHGLRHPDATDLGSDGFGPYDGPDGLADETPLQNLLTFVADFTNPVALRDNFLQATVDLVQLRRLIGNPALDLSSVAEEYGGVAPTLDATRVAYVGSSMGGLLGTLLAAVEPKTSIDPFMLDVAPGAFLSRALPDSPFGQEAFGFLATVSGLPATVFETGAHPYPHLMQAVFDGSDAAAFAADAARGPDGAGHAIWATAALYDDATPRSSTDIYVRALGATQITPTLRPVDGLPQSASPLRADGMGRVVGYFEASPGGHGHLYVRFQTVRHEAPWPREEGARFVTLPTPYTVRQACVGGQRAMSRFFRSAWDGAPEIAIGELAFAAIADADDDGYCDADEAESKLDPTMHPAGAAACMRDVGFTAE